MISREDFAVVKAARALAALCERHGFNCVTHKAVMTAGAFGRSAI